MPIHEFPVHQSNLTDEQQREALAAAYGLSGVPMSPNIRTDLTYEERIKMRRMLDDLDQREAGGLKEFDLNKPPVPPYVYREYPFLMYHHATRQTRQAVNYEQRQKMLAEGWSEDPVPIEVPEVELTATERMQAEELDRRLKMPKEQLEAESSAEHMAAMRAKIAELEAKVAHEDEAEAGDPEMATTEKSRKRSK